MDSSSSSGGNTRALDSLVLADIMKGTDAEGFIRIQPNYIRSDIVMYLSPSFLAFKRANSDDGALYIHHITDGEAPGTRSRDTVIESSSVIDRLKPRIKTILESIAANTDIDDFARILPGRVIGRVIVYANDGFTACKRAGSDTAPVYIRAH